ncbi:MAG: MFS transporter [Kiritimatiellae bacterium]|nr:MFS transporter [Kiritimatiellia bacterium]
MGKNYKWLLLAFLSMAFFFHQADRVLFGLLTIPIQDELHLTDLQIGWINTALFCTLAVMTPIGGFVGDRFSRKWIITFSLLFWSLMTACTGLVGGMCGLIFFRSIATGGGESFYVPSALALLASHHRETRSVALSVHQAALYVGLMFSGALVAWALHLFGGWRPVFFTFGGLGFLLGVVFVWALKERRDDGDKGDDGDDCKARGEKPPLVKGLKAYFCNPSALLATGGFLAVVFANNAYLSWAPKFMARKFALGVGAAGYGAMLYHHVAAFVAIMAGAFLTDACVRRNPRFRLLLQTVALLLGAPALILFGFAPSCIAAWAGVALYGVFRGLFEVNAHASLFDVVPPCHRSTAEGLMTMVAFFTGSLSPLMIGALSDKYGVRGFEIGFSILGVGYLLGAAAIAASFFFTFKKDRIVEE